MPARPPARTPRRTRPRTPYARRRLLAAGALVVVAVLVVIAALGVHGWLRGRGLMAPLPGEERCVGNANARSVVLDPDQAHYSSIVVGLSVRRGLVPRAGSIAMATAYQESGIRNLDYGDRDSVGLFQQRPSQGWGTEKQLMDPYYATTKFYNALVKVKDWETRDITKVAQTVQRSAYPEAYKAHESDARVLASALSGQSEHAFTCLVHGTAPGDAAALADSLETTFHVDTKTNAKVVTTSAKSDQLAWAYAQYAVANAGRHGVLTVEVGEYVWTTDQYTLPAWVKAPDVGRTVRVTVR